jgi:miniconductance mechanosensitive channel
LENLMAVHHPASLQIIAATGQNAAATGTAPVDSSASAGFLPALMEWELYPWLATLLGLAAVAVIAWLSLIITRAYLLKLVAALVRRSPTSWDEVLFDREVFHRLAWGVPLVVIHQGLRMVPHLQPEVAAFLQRLALAVLALVAVRIFSALLAGIQEIYHRYPMARNRPIKGYLQVLNILAYLFGGIFIIATLMDRSPWYFFSGLGAMTAIILLIFRDSLLSLVAGVQLTGNDLIRVGDWIEMPQFGADGDVTDIALNAVKVQNWDKTITVIPTHKFLEHSFKNWRGMTEAGGRRIKRAVHIDLSTIRFLDEKEIERLSRFVLLRDYMRQKVEELHEYNRQHCPDGDCLANARRLTNVGTLRAYIIQYLRQHPLVHQQLTFLIRQLAPTPEGLPIEIYVFSRETAWAVYEGIQADIFDHILAIIPEFGLQVFQKPSGADLVPLAGRLQESPRQGKFSGASREFPSFTQI